MKISLATLFIIILTVCVILFFIYAMRFVDSESGKCLESPIQYGIKELNKQNKAEFYCLCSSEKKELGVISFTEYDINLLPPT